MEGLDVTAEVLTLMCFVFNTIMGGTNMKRLTNVPACMKVHYYQSSQKE